MQISAKTARPPIRRHRRSLKKSSDSPIRKQSNEELAASQIKSRDVGETASDPSHGGTRGAVASKGEGVE